MSLTWGHAPFTLPAWVRRWWFGPVLLIGATMLNLGCGPDVVKPLPPIEARVRWVDELEAGARCYYARGDYRSIVCVRVTP